jgi:hypothetical protein
MHARVTTFEIDTLRTSIAEALKRFQELVMPELQKQPGYRGIQVLTTPDGKGLLLSFWDSAASAQQGIESGYYMEQVSKLVMFMRQPPGRDHYEVILSAGSALPAQA